MTPSDDECPKCRKHTLNVNSIEFDFYTRKCSACGYPASGEGPEAYPLPPLRKIIIYLDQFAASNIMVARDPSKKRHPSSPVNPQWLTLASILERVCRRQLAICPISPVHEVESANAKYGRLIRNVMVEFGHDVSFRDPLSVFQAQLSKYAHAWAVGKTVDWFELDVSDITDAAPHAWWKSLASDTAPLYGDALMEVNNRLGRSAHGCLAKFWSQWRSSLSGAFGDWVTEEAQSQARWLLDHDNSRTARMLRSILQDGGIHRNAVAQKARECIESAGFRKIPWIRVRAVVSAGVRHRAALAGEGCPNRGILYDLEAIETYLPYCDAMLVDIWCSDLLTKNPVAARLKVGKKVHSRRNLDRLMAYLIDIEAKAPEDHRQMVERLYGAW